MPVGRFKSGANTTDYEINRSSLFYTSNNALFFFKHGEFFDSFEYYVSTLPEKNSVMLSLFFMPEAMRKAPQGKELLAIHNKTQTKFTVRNENLSPAYSYVLSAYRWFLKGGPLSEYSKLFEMAYLKDTLAGNVPCAMFSYRQKEPIGNEKKLQSGFLLFDKNRHTLEQVIIGEGVYFSPLLWERITCKTIIRLDYDSQNKYSYFTDI